MKQFFVFVRKECYHIFRDKRTLLILFGMPLVLIILFIQRRPRGLFALKGRAVEQ